MQLPLMAITGRDSTFSPIYALFSMQFTECKRVLDLQQLNMFATGQTVAESMRVLCVVFKSDHTPVRSIRTSLTTQFFQLKDDDSSLLAVQWAGRWVVRPVQEGPRGEALQRQHRRESGACSFAFLGVFLFARGESAERGELRKGWDDRQVGIEILAGCEGIEEETCAEARCARVTSAGTESGHYTAQACRTHLPRIHATDLTAVTQLGDLAESALERSPGGPGRSKYEWGLLDLLEMPLKLRKQRVQPGLGLGPRWVITWRGMPAGGINARKDGDFTGSPSHYHGRKIAMLVPHCGTGLIHVRAGRSETSSPPDTSSMDVALTRPNDVKETRRRLHKDLVRGRDALVRLGTVLGQGIVLLIILLRPRFTSTSPACINISISNLRALYRTTGFPVLCVGLESVSNIYAAVSPVALARRDGQRRHAVRSRSPVACSTGPPDCTFGPRDYSAAVVATIFSSPPLFARVSVVHFRVVPFAVLLSSEMSTFFLHEAFIVISIGQAVLYNRLVGMYSVSTLFNWRFHGVTGAVGDKTFVFELADLLKKSSSNQRALRLNTQHERT
ncbi:hypothetical protein DFH06DRAFT_1392742 [Mycena polygramma]|nr:hypothetical protein DFH06DRAFT_1392742 [Mycena polygramma]